MSKKKSCPFCRVSLECGAVVDNTGDSFVLQHRTKESWELCGSGNHDFLILKIRFCPLCGRRLKKGEKHGKH